MSDSSANQDGRRWVWAIALLTALVSLAIAFDFASPWLRGPGVSNEWTWRYDPEPLLLSRTLVALVPVALLLAWYALASRRQRVGNWLLLALVPIGVAFQMSVLSTRPEGIAIVARVLNPGYFGYYGPATEVADLGDFIDTYAGHQALFEHPRLQTHPPGNVVFHWLGYRAVEAVPLLTRLAEPLITPRLESLPDWIADYDLTEITGGMVMSVVIPIITTLAIFPLFWLARAAFSEETARRTVLLFLLAPSVTLFQPKIDEIFILLSALAFLLAHTGFRTQNLPLIYLAGVACSVGLFMTYALLPLIAVVGLFLVGMALSASSGWQWEVVRRHVSQLLVFGLGVVTVQIASTLLLGFEPVRSFFVMFGRHRQVNLARNYAFSLIYTPYEILLFAGLPAAALLVGRLAWTIRQLRRRASMQVVNWLLVATTVVLLAAILTGMARSENARLYLFLVPAITLFAGAESERLGVDTRQFALLASLTFVQLLVFHAVLVVFL